MLRHIKIAIFLLCITIPLMLGGIYKSIKTTQMMSRGNYFFENSRNNPSVSKIILGLNNEKITFHKKENFWLVREADDYYASFGKMKSLLNLIYSTTVYRADTSYEHDFDSFTKNALSIQTFDGKNQLLDNVFIAPKQNNNQFHYAIKNEEKVLYQLNNLFSVSSNVMDWIEAPLLSIPHRQVKKIKTNDFEVSRRYATEELTLTQNHHSVPQILNLLNNLWYLSPIEVKHIVHFNQKDYNLVKQYEISTLGGLIYLIDIFNKGDEYWFSIKLAQDKIISSEASRFFKENKILYDGWFFKIEKDLAENIASFAL